jgi:hypothetical protein
MRSRTATPGCPRPYHLSVRVVVVEAIMPITTTTTGMPLGFGEAIGGEAPAVVSGRPALREITGEKGIEVQVVGRLDLGLTADRLALELREQDLAPRLDGP